MEIEDDSRAIESDLDAYLPEIKNHISSLDGNYHSAFRKLMADPSQGKTEITPQMRSVLIRWIIQVGDKFKTNPETLHICVQMVDFVLVSRAISINRVNYQLLGIAALFVAAKYNEINAQQADRYVFICDGLYSF